MGGGWQLFGGWEGLRVLVGYPVKVPNRDPPAAD